MLGLVAGLAPLRAGLPTAIILACLEGTIEDFVGSPARYWKEAFVAALVAQMLLARRPRRLEVAAAAALVLTFGVYHLTGTKADAAAWAAKILFLGAVAGYAVYRLRPDARVWHVSFYALTVAAGANVMLAVWQRIKGLDHLFELGLTYGDRIRQADGDIRAFGAFTGAAPFSYALALVLLAWVAMAIGSRADRRLAIETGWLLVATVAGIALSLDRIALVALAVAMVVVALRIAKRPAARALLGLAALAVGLVFAFGFSSSGFLAEGFLFRSDSAKVRRAVWTEYSKELSAFGAGPGAAGAAYERWQKPRQRELPVVLRGWHGLERGELPFQWMRTTGVLEIGAPARARPASTLAFFSSSHARPRSVTFRLAGKLIATRVISEAGFSAFAVGVPGGFGVARVELRATPGAERLGSTDPRSGSIRMADARALTELTPAEQVYQRVRTGHGLSVAALAGTEPGVVDNLYLSWLFQYGIVLGAPLCAFFVAILLWPMLRGPDNSLVSTATLWGVFVVIAALVVNVWEEFPTDLLVALVFGQALWVGGAGGSKGDGPSARYFEANSR